MKLSKRARRYKYQSKISHKVKVFLQRRRGMCYSPMLTTSSQIRDIHSVSLVELTAKLRLGTGNQDYLKGVLRSLRSCEVEWNLLKS